MLRLLPVVLSKPFSCYPPGSFLHTTAVATTRWYKNSFITKHSSKLPRKVAVIPPDCENQPYQTFNPTDVVSVISSLPTIETLDENKQKVMTYRFVSKREKLNDTINAKLEMLGYHPTDSSIGAKVIRMTMLLRYKKERVKKHPKNGPLLQATKILMQSRVYALRLLRATNISEFDRLREALQIVEFRFPNPYNPFPDDPLNQRKKAVREECYHSRMNRLAELKVDLASSEKEFYQRKENTLKNLLQDLETVVDGDAGGEKERREKAEELLQKLFQEVVAERQTEVLHDPERDTFHWYEWEQKQRERYLDRMKRKEMMQLKSKR